MAVTAPVLSVLIPAYQCTQTLGRAVDSVLATDATEVVIAPDDGSDAYHPFAVAGRVRVLQPTLSTGPSAGRNRAFAAARGDFITMLDCDDYFAPRALDEALLLAQSSRQRIAFLRTVYYFEASGAVCRELPALGVLDMASFTAFHGSVHALYHRSCWHAYSEHRISQDVLHDARILQRAGGQALLTEAPYMLALQSASITATTTQDAFNTEYASIIANDPDPGIRALYREKLRVGALYAEALRQGLDASFHAFVRDLTPSRSAVQAG